MKKASNTQPIEPMDERQRQITGKAIVFGFLFLVLCLLIATIWRIATSAEAGWELFAIVGASLVIVISRRIMGDIEQPLDYKNRPLPTGNTKPEKRIRCKSYAVGSVIFGAAFGVMDILLLAFGENEVSEKELAQLIFPNLSKGLTIVITAIIAFVSMFLISYVFDYLVGEYKVKRYNAMLAALDLEDDD